jgi:hypothetical protein
VGAAAAGAFVGWELAIRVYLAFEALEGALGASTWAMGLGLERSSSAASQPKNTRGFRKWIAADAADVRSISCEEERLDVRRVDTFGVGGHALGAQELDQGAEGVEVGADSLGRLGRGL